MAFLDEIGSKLLQLEKKAKVAAKEPEFTLIEAKIVKFCTEPRVSSSIIELFPARPHNVLGIVQSLVKRGILLSCTNKYVANLEHRDFNVVMTMTANKKADVSKYPIGKQVGVSYDGDIVSFGKLVSVDEADGTAQVDFISGSDRVSLDRLILNKAADTSSDIATTWNNADDLQREDLLKAVNITSDYIRQYSAIDSFDLLPIWLQNALRYEKKASVLPVDETLWKNEIKDTVANLKADNITFKDAQEMTDYLVGDKGDLTVEQKEYASQLYNESANVVAERTNNVTKVTELLKKENVDAEDVSPNFVADFAYNHGIELKSAEVVEISNKYAVKKKADETPENLIFELNPKYWDVQKLVTDLKNKGIPFEVVERGSLRTDLIPATRKDYAEIYEDIYETDNYYKYFNEIKQSPKKAELDTIAADELFLYIENDGQLYERFFKPIIKNLTKKKKNNTYDSELAVKAFAYLAEEGAKKYAKDFGGIWNTMFDVSTRKQVATDFRDKFESLYENKEYDFMEDTPKQASAYTDFVGKYMKENKGSSIGDAAKAWSKQKGKSEDKTDDKAKGPKKNVKEDKSTKTKKDVVKEGKEKVEKKAALDYSKEGIINLVEDGYTVYAVVESTDLHDQEDGTQQLTTIYHIAKIDDIDNYKKSGYWEIDDTFDDLKNAVSAAKSRAEKEAKGLYVGEQLEGVQAKKADTSDIKVIDVEDATEEQATNFYEYPSYKIFDDEHVYLVAEYQLIIDNGVKYVITDDVLTVNNKLQDGSLELNWELDAYNFDTREKKADSENNYFVVGDHPVLGRPDTYNLTKEEAETLAEDLKDMGYENIKIDVFKKKAYDPIEDTDVNRTDGGFDEEEELEEEFNEPEPGDYVMYDSGHLGSKMSVGVVDGGSKGFLGEFDDEDSAMIAIKEDMELNKFWPNIWYQDDHGGLSLRTASKKQAAGDDYDTEFFDEIVNQLANAGFSANHKFFDQYQGPYLDVRDIDTFWIAEVYSRGTKSKEDLDKPYIKAVLIDAEGNTYSATRDDYFQLKDDYVFEDYTLVLTKQNGEEVEIENPKKSDLPDLLEVESTFTYEKGTMTEVYIFTPEDDPEIGIEVTNKNGVVDASDLVDYCKSVRGVEASVKTAASGYDFSVVNTNGFEDSVINVLSPFGQVNYEEEGVEEGGSVLEIGVLDVPANKLIAFAKTVESLGASIWSVAIGNWGVWAENLDDLTPTEFVTQVLNAKEASIKKADDEKTVTEVVNVPRKISPLEKTKDIPREEYIVAKEANDTLKDLYKSVMELSSQIATDEEEIKRVAAEMKKTKEIDPSKALLQESIEKLTKMLSESDKIVTINAEKVLKLVEKSSEEPVLSETVLAKLDEMREKHRQIEEDYIKSAGAQMKEIKRTITQELKVIPLRANKTAISFKDIFNKIKNFFTGWMSEAKDFGKELDAITW